MRAARLAAVFTAAFGLNALADMLGALPVAAVAVPSAAILGWWVGEWVGRA